MKYILGLIMLTLAFTASAGMLLADGTPRPVPYTIAELTKQCDFKGYFVYDSTIYMCVKIREDVSKEELGVYHRADLKRQIAKAKARDKWYKDWIKTDEGQAWKKNYDAKLKEKNAKGHK